MGRRPAFFWATASLLVIVAAWGAANLSTDPGDGQRWDLVHWTLSSLTGAALAAFAWRRSPRGTAGRSLRFWTTLSLGANALGQLAYDLFVLSGQTGLPWASGVVFIAVGPLMVAGLAVSWKRRPGERPLTGIALDSILVTLGTVSLLLVILLPGQRIADAASIASLVVFPLTLFAASSTLLVFAVHDGVTRWLPARSLMIAALFGFGLIEMVWGLDAINDLQRSGTTVNLLSSLVPVGLGAAVGGWSWSRDTRVTGFRASVIVLLPVGGLMALLGAVFIAAVDRRMPEWALPLFGVLAVPGAVLSLIRQAYLVRSIEQGRRDAARSIELADALGRLQQTQDQLIRSAKLAALGQIAAGITHDLNTPLGAIRSAASLLQTQAVTTAAMFERWSALSPEGRELFGRLAQALEPQGTFLDSRTERRLRHEVAAEVAAAGHPDAEVLAQALVDTGLGGRTELREALWRSRDPGSVLAAFEPLGAVNRLSQVVSQASAKASDVVQALHNFLRSDAEAQRELIDVAENIRGVLPLFQHQRGRAAQVEAEVTSGLWTVGWPDKLAQVWVNLLTNAVQAAGREGHVRLTCGPHQGTIEVVVTDDGPGVPDDLRDRIFDPFFTTKPRGEGTGIGLDVCRRVVGELGGTIGFESAPGHTSFRVVLPTAVP